MLLGLVLEELNHLSRQGREVWSVAPGPGLTFALAHPAELFRQLEVSDGSLKLPVRWMELMPTKAYVLVNAVVQAFAIELMIDVNHPATFGYRFGAKNRLFWVGVVSTKNSKLASGNLEQLLDAQGHKRASSAAQVVQIQSGALRGQSLVWKASNHQFAAVLGPTVRGAQAILDQIEPKKIRTQVPLQKVYQSEVLESDQEGKIKGTNLQALKLDLSFVGDALVLRGLAEGTNLPVPAELDRASVRLAIRGPAPMQHVWVAQQADGQWCQQGLPPAWQNLFTVHQRCASEGPPGWYTYLSPALFERLKLPWKEVGIAVDAHADGLAIHGRATSTSRPRIFPILKQLGGVLTGAQRASVEGRGGQAVVR